MCELLKFKALQQSLNVAVLVSHLVPICIIVAQV